MTRRYRIFLLVLLGSFSAFAPLINNTLGPIIGNIAADLGVGPDSVSWGFTAGMVGLALGQLIFGPLSDKIGRRGIVVSTVAIFALASLLIGFAQGLTAFLTLRFLQGLGGSGGIVLARSIAADNFRGHELVGVIAVIDVITGLAPIVAPMLTAGMTALGGWRALFGLVALIGLILLGCSLRLRESLPVERRSQQSLLRTFGLYGRVARNRTFVAYVLQLCTAEMILFGNIASVQPILASYGYTGGQLTTVSSLVLSANGIFVALGAAGAAAFKSARMGVRASCAGMLVLSAITLAVLWSHMSVWIYETALCLLLLMMGITLTVSTSLAMESARNEAGTASAMFGAAGFIIGAVVAPLVDLGDPTHSTPLVFLIGAVLSAFFALVARPKQA